MKLSELIIALTRTLAVEGEMKVFMGDSASVRSARLEVVKTVTDDLDDREGL